MRQLEVVILAVLIRVGRNSLHVQATTIHGIILGIIDLLLLRDLDVQRRRLVLVEQVVELVVRRAVHRRLLRRVDATVPVVPAQDALVVPQVRWRLLEAVVVREGRLDLVHVQASV